MTVLEAYISTLQQLSSSSEIIRHYPALVYPASLLPHSKTTINKAIRETKELAFLNKDYQLVQLLDWALSYLDSFLPDLEACQKNAKILEQKTYLHAVKMIH